MAATSKRWPGTTENSGGETHAVKGKLPNGWGLVRHAGECVGVVQRWLAGGLLGSPRGGTEARERLSPASSGVAPGASVARFARAADRGRNAPSARIDYLGFRCAEFKAGL